MKTKMIRGAFRKVSGMPITPGSLNPEESILLGVAALEPTGGLRASLYRVTDGAPNLVCYAASNGVNPLKGRALDHQAPLNWLNAIGLMDIKGAIPSSAKITLPGESREEVKRGHRGALRLPLDGKACYGLGSKLLKVEEASQEGVSTGVQMWTIDEVGSPVQGEEFTLPARVLRGALKSKVLGNAWGKAPEIALAWDGWANKTDLLRVVSDGQPDEEALQGEIQKAQDALLEAVGVHASKTWTEDGQVKKPFFKKLYTRIMRVVEFFPTLLATPQEGEFTLVRGASSPEEAIGALMVGVKSPAITVSEVELPVGFRFPNTFQWGQAPWDAVGA